MKQVLGIGGLLLVVFVATALMSDAFLKPFNLENLMKRSALFGIISIGVAFVIITGGIDLSIGSIICLVGCGLPFLLQVEYVAVGQVPVVSAKVATGTLELARPPTGLSVGDRIGLAGGKNRNVGVYRVASVTGTSVSLESGPEVDDSGGRLTRILSAEPGPNGLTVAGHRLQVRDRVTFVLEDGREGATARVLSVDGDRLGLSESPPDDFSGLYGLDRRPWTSVPVALGIVLGASLAIGLFHGLLIAKLKLQPFVVTLCGLLLYRGITRGFTQDQTQGLIDEYPTLKLIATAQLARLPMTWGLLVLGGVLLVGALVWGWMIRRRAAAARVSLGDLVIPAVTLVMGVSLLGWGVGTISPLETLPIEASEREEVRVDLPTRTTRVRMQARAAGSASWVTLAEIRVEESERTQELTVPSLETIRAARPGDWSQLQVVVLERARLEIGLPAPLVILLVVALIASVFLNRTIYGRYLLAMGNNEQAARYSGIDTDRMIILAYVICAGLAGLGGVLFVLDINSAQPVDFGNFYELYAIAAAVLGGCSLRGGQGTILGVVIGAALMRVLKNMITLVDWMPTYIEYAIIGAVILAGVTVDELVKRAAARRRLQRIRGGADESGR
jgi:ribose/xylose/arabinose/galactoside ABC-type transport system permease subunit